jgi:hypothetical protein
MANPLTSKPKNPSGLRGFCGLEVFESFGSPVEKQRVTVGYLLSGRAG